MLVDQLTTLSSMERSLSPLCLGGESADAAEGGALPRAELVQRRAEAVTRAISELWAAARDQHPRLQQRGDSIRHAVRALLALFPQVRYFRFRTHFKGSWQEAVIGLVNKSNN